MFSRTKFSTMNGNPQRSPGGLSSVFQPIIQETQQQQVKYISLYSLFQLKRGLTINSLPILALVDDVVTRKSGHLEEFSVSQKTTKRFSTIVSFLLNENITTLFLLTY
uniref:Uncharacterized protein n=1 Tax=Cacopsylla melanoneura TaxID=428564 RepID=A0A8D8R8W5_9HEMI